MRILNLRARFGACLLCLFFFGLPLSGDIISDNFNDNALDTSLWRPFFSGATGSVSEINQRLEVTVTGAPEGFGGVALRGLVTGDFDLRISYVLIGAFDSLDPDLYSQGVGFTWLPGTGSFLVRGVADIPGVGLTGCIGGQVDSAIKQDCYAFTSEQSGSLRLTRSGNVYTMYHLENSVWAPLASAPSVQTGPVDFYFGAGIAGMTLNAAFDNFSLRSDGFRSEVPEPCSLALAGIALGLGWRVRKRLSG